MGNQSLYSVIDTQTPDNLIADLEETTSVEGITLLAGQGVLSRGSVIGIITASQKGKLAAKANSDGSQVAKYILADTVDTTSADVVTQCYRKGSFNRQALKFAASNSAADHEDSLRQYGIFLKDNISY
jgi:hypothetical protein